MKIQDNVFFTRAIAGLGAIMPVLVTAGLIVSMLGAIVGYFGFRATLENLLLQKQLFDEQMYARNQSSIGLAWTTLGQANEKAYELGQSSSLLFLALNGSLAGNVTLNGSTLKLFDGQIADDSYAQIDLSNSTLCRTDLTLWTKGRLALNLSYSTLRKSPIHGNFSKMDFLAADLSEAKLDNIEGRNTRFAAVNFNQAILVGGRFVDSDFEEADFSGVKTERGWKGVNSPASSEYSEYGTGFFADDQPFEWPLVLDPKLGKDDLFRLLGRETSDISAANYVVDFTNARFRYANLKGAHLKQSNISQQQVDDACADSTTVRADSTTVLPKNVSVRIDDSCNMNVMVAEHLRTIKAPTGVNTSTQSNCEIGPRAGRFQSQ